MNSINSKITMASWLKVTFIASTVIPIVGFVKIYKSQGFSAVAIALLAISVIGFLGIIEVFVSRIVLQADSIEIVRLFRRRSIVRSDISSVTWEKGCGVSIKLKDGHWAKLPDTGRNALAQTNTLRAWLKSTKTSQANDSESNDRESKTTPNTGIDTDSAG